MPGGRKTTTWEKGKKPPVQKPKGRKNNKTVIKEALGLTGWEKLGQYIDGKGAERAIAQLQRMNGKSFIIGLQALTEYHKPKLARSEVTGGGGQPLIPQMDTSKLTDAELATLIALQEKAAAK